MIRNVPTNEQYSLFRAYLDSRHADGGMVDMSAIDFAMMVEDSHVETRLVEYRKRRDTDRPGELLGVALTDVLPDGLSMVYSFYDPDEGARSLGTYMILDHIARAKALGLPHLYLGYWVEGSRKMDYKARYLPQERLGMLAWDRVDRG
jgi:arginine-tRNA-protein transferase